MITFRRLLSPSLTLLLAAGAVSPLCALEASVESALQLENQGRSEEAVSSLQAERNQAVQDEKSTRFATASLALSYCYFHQNDLSQAESFVREFWDQDEPIDPGLWSLVDQPFRDWYNGHGKAVYGENWEFVPNPPRRFQPSSTPLVPSYRLGTRWFVDGQFHDSSADGDNLDTHISTRLGLEFDPSDERHGLLYRGMARLSYLDNSDEDVGLSISADLGYKYWLDTAATWRLDGFTGLGYGIGLSGGNSPSFLSGHMEAGISWHRPVSDQTWRFMLGYEHATWSFDGRGDEDVSGLYWGLGWATTFGQKSLPPAPVYMGERPATELPDDELYPVGSPDKNGPVQDSTGNVVGDTAGASHPDMESTGEHGTNYSPARPESNPTRRDPPSSSDWNSDYIVGAHATFGSSDRKLSRVYLGVPMTSSAEEVTDLRIVYTSYSVDDLDYVGNSNTSLEAWDIGLMYTFGRRWLFTESFGVDGTIGLGYGIGNAELDIVADDFLMVSLSGSAELGVSWSVASDLSLRVYGAYLGTWIYGNSSEVNVDEFDDVIKDIALGAEIRF